LQKCPAGLWRAFRCHISQSFIGHTFKLQTLPGAGYPFVQAVLQRRAIAGDRDREEPPASVQLCLKHLAGQQRICLLQGTYGCCVINLSLAQQIQQEQAKVRLARPVRAGQCPGAGGVSVIQAGYDAAYTGKRLRSQHVALGKTRAVQIAVKPDGSDSRLLDLHKRIQGKGGVFIHSRTAACPVRVPIRC